MPSFYREIARIVPFIQLPPDDRTCRLQRNRPPRTTPRIRRSSPAHTRLLGMRQMSDYNHRCRSRCGRVLIAAAGITVTAPWFAQDERPRRDHIGIHLLWNAARLHVHHALGPYRCGSSRQPSRGRARKGLPKQRQLVWPGREPCHRVGCRGLSTSEGVNSNAADGRWVASSRPQLILVHLRKNETLAQFGAEFGVSTATAGLHTALERAVGGRKEPCVLVRWGAEISGPTQSAADGPTGKLRQLGLPGRPISPY
jgi:hypothetical protein